MISILAVGCGSHIGNTGAVFLCPGGEGQGEEAVFVSLLSWCFWHHPTPVLHSMNMTLSLCLLHATV